MQRAWIFLVFVSLGVNDVIADDALTHARVLSRLAETEIHVFALYEPDVATTFRKFLEHTPMSNNRPVPAILIADTVAALSFYRSAAPPTEPSYFVASYADKSVVLPLSQNERDTVRRRYGEDVYPQTVCPIFATSAGSDVRGLLSSAVGLPAHYFESVPGNTDNYHLLYLLTEASHCGFLDRTVHEADLKAPLTRKDAFRSVIEAIGDYEATVAFRALVNPGGAPDEGDVLLAARILSTFLNERSNAYSSIPAFALVYQELGVIEGTRRIDRVNEAVAEARSHFRHIMDANVVASNAEPSLADMATWVESSLSSNGHAGSAKDMSRKLLSQFSTAVRILSGTPGVAFDRRGNRRANLTLPGASRGEIVQVLSSADSGLAL